MSMFKTTQRDKDVALSKAILKGDLKGMESALQDGADPANPDKKQKSSYGTNYYKTFVGDLIAESGVDDKVKLDMYRIVIRHGLNIQDVGAGVSLLSKVVSSQRLHQCKGLVGMLVKEYQADVCAVNKDGYAAFDSAMSSYEGSEKEALFLLGLGGIGPYSAYSAIRNNKTTFLKAIMEVADCAEGENAVEALKAFRGPEHEGMPVQKIPDTKNIREWGIFAAVQKANVASFEYMASACADKINFSFRSNESSFLHLVDLSNADAHKIALSLIAHGAPVEEKTRGKENYRDKTALELFCDKGPEHKIEPVITALIDKARERGVLSEMHLDKAVLTAVYHESNFGVLGLLLDAGANVNAVNNNEHTPLMLAAQRCDIETVEFLLGRGADKTKATAQGLTAYDMIIIKMQETQKNNNEDSRRKIVLYNRIKDMLAKDAAPVVKKAVAVNAEAAIAEDGVYSMPNKQTLSVDQGDGLTMTFNFWTQEVVYRDAAGGMRVRNFDEIQRQAAITEAYEKLKAMGGEPSDPAIIMMPGKKKVLGGSGGMS